MLIIKKVELICGKLTLSCSAKSIQARQLLAVAIYKNNNILNEKRVRMTDLSSKVTPTMYSMK